VTVSGTSTLREAGTSQPARRSVKRRLSGTHLLIGVVAVLAVVLNLMALQNRDATVLVAVADEPLSVGGSIDSSLIRLVEVPADFEALDSLLDGEALAGYDGWVLSRNVPEGGLIGRADLIEPGASDGLRSMALPIELEHAAGGTISPGDIVDVISVVDGAAAYVGTAIEVLGVADRDDSGFAAGSVYHLVLAVDSDLALALAEAIESGSIEIVRSTGAAELDMGVGVDEP
jgi:Flp pilus assembly protein CpaB